MDDGTSTMRRRRVLVASGVALGGLGSLAGCLDAGDPAGNDDGAAGSDGGAVGDETDDRGDDGIDHRDPTEFEQCGRLIVSADELPAPAREEVEAAVDGGHETTGEPFVPNLIDVNASFVRIDGDAHRIRVEDDGDVTRITAEETIPSRGARSVRLDNRSGADLTASLTVVHSRDDETVVDAVADLPAGESDSLGEAFEREFGRYEATIAIEPANDAVIGGSNEGGSNEGGGSDGEGDPEVEWSEETIAWREEEFTMPFEGMELRPEEPVPIPRAVLEPVDCRGVWDLH